MDPKRRENTEDMEKSENDKKFNNLFVEQFLIFNIIWSIVGDVI